MSIELCEAVRVYARYDLPDEKGETRRERNEKFETETPPKIISDEARYLWEWYEDLRNWVSRISDGVCKYIPPTEFTAWAQITGRIIFPEEFKVLHEMDVAFSDEVNKELTAFRERRQEQQKSEIEKAKNRRRK